MLIIKLLTATLCFGIMSTVETTEKMKTIYEWKYIEFDWGSEEFMNKYVQKESYGPRYGVPLDVDTWKDGRIFVTVVRDDGVHASLGTVSNKTGKGGPLLTPYPNWNWTSVKSCDSIINVFRIAIDECDRLWVLDNGWVGETRHCPAKLLYFDLNTDTLLGKHIIPKSVATNSVTKEGLLITPVVDTEGDRCEKTTVYMSDVVGHGLAIFSNGSFWRVESPVFEPVSSLEKVYINGTSFRLLDGVIGMALSPRKCFGKSRKLVFRPFSSLDMVWAETSDLENRNATCPISYTTVSRILPSPAPAMAISSKNVVFLVPATQMALSCWNMDKSIENANLVTLDTDSTRYQFASGVKIIRQERTGRPEELWILTNRYHRYLNKKQNHNEINYRVMTGVVEDLVANTDCQPQSSFWNFISHVTCFIQNTMRH